MAPKKQVEKPSMVEVTLCVETPSSLHVVYLPDYRVEFIDGMATVSAEVAEALKASGIAK